MWVLDWFWFILPAIIANMSPVIIKAKLENSRLFIGIFVALCALSLLFGRYGYDEISLSLLLMLLGVTLLYFKKYNWPIDFKMKSVDGNRILGDGKTMFGFLIGVICGTLVGIIQGRAVLGFLLSLGTMVGDSIGSFIKRRLRVKQGKNAPLIDDTIFVIVAFFFVYPFYSFPFYYLPLSVVAAPILHKIANIFAHKVKLKEVPW